MERAPARVGVDLGALYAKGVRLDAAGNVVARSYRRHRGQLEAAFDATLEAVGFQPGDLLGVTGAAAGRITAALGVPGVDLVQAQLSGVAARGERPREILDIGGGSCSLIQLDAAGRFQGHGSNSLCAAGTGSFLDEQAERLGISHGDAAAFGHVADPPSIATRCSVFAKSDLIHRQQEGYSRPAMWSGLCRGMTRTLLGTLLSGRPPAGRTVVIGGVAQNPTVLRWLRQAHGDLIAEVRDPHLVAAHGAALLAGPAAGPCRLAARAAGPAEGLSVHPWPLTLERSRFPSFACAEAFVDGHGTEVRLLARPAGPVVPVHLGIDVGSTSTKAVAVGEDLEVVADVYRRTDGDPIGATQLILGALRTAAARLGVSWDVRGVGTTGSGRALVGAVVGADAVINEISAHVAGAVHFDPAVDTIFEIGGQDSKYMHVVDGQIRDANMNYVCAAGTGSFVEEQARRLGLPVAEVGRAVLGVVPPRASDRCTVFMEQDVAALQRAGATRAEALAAVLVAVVKNYLNKVVGNRHRSRTRITFQGATARNPALVAAFERVLGVEVVVSPCCHVMGAFGVALLTRQALEARGRPASSFRGLDLDQRRISIRKEACALCQNGCTITYADVEGVEPAPSWGYLCGRDPAERRQRVTSHDRYLRLRQRLWREAAGPVPAGGPVIGIPRALAGHTFAPMWRRFFAELGLRTRLSPETSQELRDLGGRLAGADFCFPAKVAVAHVAWLARQPGIDWVFLPELANQRPRPEVTASTHCPYVQAWPACARTALSQNGLDAGRLLTPLLDERMPEARLLEHLAGSLAGPLGRTPRQIARAWRRAREAHEALQERLQAAGAAALAEARRTGERLVVLVGRPYNTADGGMNLALPQKIAERGLTVLPMDLLRPDLARLGERYRNVYWTQGQDILAVLLQVAGTPGVDAIYLTNFGCGPDSFLLSYAQEIMGTKPFLALELDEHGGDAGYLTRLEAFLDVLGRARSPPAARRPVRPEPADFRSRTLWLPIMHELGVDFFAAAFARHGYDARPLPLETDATFELGRSLVRGGECLPTALTIGALVATLQAQGLREGQALFMPTACGPCRFGQYCQLHRQILDRVGLPDVAILSPSSVNAYQGVDESLRRAIFKAMVVSDLLLKARCKARPYELVPGSVDRIVGEERARICAAIRADADLPRALRAAVDRIEGVPRRPGRRPIVGVVGEVYVRNNPYANEGLIAAIERLGGEAWPAPVAEWLLFVASPRNYRQYLERRLGARAFKAWATHRWQRHWDHLLHRAAGPFLADRREPELDRVLDEAEAYLAHNIGGEAVSIVGRTALFAQEGAALVVNCAPFGCMPGTVTTALLRRLSAEHGMPVVSLFYDGQGTQNRRLEVFLASAVRRGPAEAAAGLAGA
jgi:predicted CoA-substrate-specific enzyme activase